MKRLGVALVAVLLAMTCVAAGGCSVAGGVAAQLRADDRIAISGSRTCVPLVEVLQKGYGEPAAFTFLASVSSSGGIEGVANGDVDIGAVARYLNDEELELGLRYELLSWDAIVFAVHRSVTIDALTTGQIRDIYTGGITNWSELGGPDLPIVVFDRTDGGTTKQMVRRWVLGEDTVVTPEAIEVNQEPDMVDSVRGTRGAIGYVSHGWLLARKVPVTVLTLDGITPNVSNTLNGTYRLTRPLGLVVSNDAPEEVTSFVDWAISPEAGLLLASAGYAPAR